MVKTKLLLLLCGFSAPLLAQFDPPIASIEPRYAVVGSAGLRLRAVFQIVPPGTVLLWDGEPRPARVVNNVLETDLTAQDLSRPRRVEISLANRLGHRYPQRFPFFVGHRARVRSLAWDPRRHRLYVSVGSGQPRSSLPQSRVVALDPDTGRVVGEMSPGAEPGIIALSGDQRYLYTATGAATVARHDLQSGAQDLVISLPPASQGRPPRITGLAVLPGFPRTVAVAWSDPVSGTGRILLFDDAVRRTGEGATQNNTGIAFAPDGGEVYTADTRGLWTFQVSAAGVSNGQRWPGLAAAPVAVTENRLITAGGAVLDRIARLPLAEFNFGPSSIAWDPERGRGFAFHAIDVGSMPDSLSALTAFDPVAPSRFGSSWLRPLDIDFGSPPDRHLVRWGEDGIAFVQGDALAIFRTPMAGPRPAINPAGILHAASLQTGAVAPGGIVTLYGTNLGPAVGKPFHIEIGNRVPSELAGVRVFFDHLPGTVLYASASQVNVVAPAGMRTGGRVRLQLWHAGIPSQQMEIASGRAAPGLFTQTGTGLGAAAALNSNGSLNTPDNPAARGSHVVLFGAGGGLTSSGGGDGSVSVGADPLQAHVIATVGGQPAAILYAGAAPGLVSGVLQINLTIPENVASGDQVPVVIQVDGVSSRNGVTLAIR